MSELPNYRLRLGTLNTILSRDPKTLSLAGYRNWCGYVGVQLPPDHTRYAHVSIRHDSLPSDPPGSNVLLHFHDAPGLLLALCNRCPLSSAEKLEFEAWLTLRLAGG